MPLFWRPDRGAWAAGRRCDAPQRHSHLPASTPAATGGQRAGTGETEAWLGVAPCSPVLLVWWRDSGMARCIMLCLSVTRNDDAFSAASPSLPAAGDVKEVRDGGRLGKVGTSRHRERKVNVKYLQGREAEVTCRRYELILCNTFAIGVNALGIEGK